MSTQAGPNPFAQLFNVPTVRLAALEAGSGDEALRLKTINANPRDAGHVCISYDRSEGSDHQREVEVDGQTIQIPDPLFSALKALRKTNGPRHVWTDLLIGRTVEEQSTQAHEMKAVLEQAETTICWLGPTDSQREAALDMTRTLANKWTQARAQFNIPEAHMRATKQQLGNAQAFIISKGDELQVSDKALWETVQELFCHSYFGTIHSVPEILLSQNARVTVGDETVPWEDFAAAVIGFTMLFPSLPFSPGPKMLESISRIMQLQTDTRRKRNGESLELFPMIKNARQLSHRDPREIVFSVLPVVTPCTRTEDDPQRPSLPKADFSAPVVDVFKQASKYILEDRQDLMMWWAERPPCGRKLAGLPSWAIDWNNALLDGTGGINLNMESGFRKWADPLNNKRIYVDDDDGLHVQGHPIDRIDIVSPIFTEANFRSLCLKEFQHLPPLPNETGGAHMERLARTLVLNIAGTGETFRTNATPSAEIVHSFTSLIAEERILQVLGCSIEELVTKSPEFVAEAKAKPEIQALNGLPGHSQAFEELCRKNTLGRRLFRCKSGRIGMTSVETPPAGEDGATPVPNFDDVMGDPLAGVMMDSFRSFLAQRDPNAANAVAQGLSGTLPGQRLPGVRSGDVVVALIGGYQPYILRPALDRPIYQGPSAGPDAPSGTQDFLRHGNTNAVREEEEALLMDSTKYSFVGDCYLHGEMDGEHLKQKGWFGRLVGAFRQDIEVVDITIV